MNWETKQTRIEIYEYIKSKRENYPEIFLNGLLHNYFTEDLITLKEAEEKIEAIKKLILDSLARLRVRLEHRIYSETLTKEMLNQVDLKIFEDELKQSELLNSPEAQNQNISTEDVTEHEEYGGKPHSPIRGENSSCNSSVASQHSSMTKPLDTIKEKYKHCGNCGRCQYFNNGQCTYPLTSGNIA